MKHIKTFEQFVNESNVDEIASRFKPKKPNWPFFFQIHPRDKKSIESGEDKHKVTVKKGENVNDVEKQVLKDYPHNKYYYTLWKNVRGGFKNIGTNESEELTEEFLNSLSESKINKYSPLHTTNDVKKTSNELNKTISDITDFLMMAADQSILSGDEASKIINKLIESIADVVDDEIRADRLERETSD